ncbi:MAG: class I SAM-dependent methyltransferase [Solirubrobacterales bacterium]|nr:class I SAM-dependent methyltransferase [Solirubrobacterales bacterium]
MGALGSLKESVPRRYRFVAREVLVTVSSPVFAGDAFTCPCCLRSSRRWITIGHQEQLCPRCFAGARHRLLMLYVERRTSLLRAPMRLLHFAPEHSLMRRFRHQPNLDYLAADLDPPFGAIRLDLTAIDLPADSVDCVICSHVLEHIPDDRRAMEEMRRVLRPGGQALIMVPVDQRREHTFEDPSIVTPAQRLEAFNQEDHVRVYGLDFVRRLEEAGFGVDCHGAESFGEEAMQRMGLPSGDKELLYVCA